MRATSFTLGILLLLPLAASPAPAAAEGPTSGACDESGLLVCAGASVGARVACAAADAQGRVACAWTYGWITSASSPAGLSGTETHAITLTLTTCAGADPCSGSSHTLRRACAWLPAGSCDASFGSEEATVTATLAPGECLRVEIALHGAIEAKVPDLHHKLAKVRHDTHGEAAGAACVVDDGR